ncbi:MAG: peptidoglycan-binding domain-containing protein [Candidatus Nanopelagicales bacterium]
MTRVMPLRALAGAGIASAMLVGLAVPAQADTVDQTHTVVAPRVAANQAAIAALPLLVAGDTGTYVKRVEAMLHITVTARFDNRVKNAVIAFQKAHGLRANGQVGYAVWSALIADWRIYLRTPRTVAAAAPAPTGVVLGEPVATRNRAVPYSLRGVYASAYIGSYYDKRFEAKRRCIVNRESHGYYTVRSANGMYNGAYQMTASLGVGVTKKMLSSVAAEVGASTAASLMAKLRTTTPNRWSRYWQDRAFWTIFNHGAGASHWAGGYVNC